MLCFFNREKVVKKLDFITKEFAELTNWELHEIIRLRIDIFVVEQTCPYPELDGKDPLCAHVFNVIDGKMAAYCRVVPPGVSYEHAASIGRVVVNEKFRHRGLGELLIAQGIKVVGNIWPGVDLKISAQAHLQDFYRLNKFVTTSDEYLEDNIPHVEMTYEKQ